MEKKVLVMDIVIFCIVAIVHGLRVVFGWELKVGSIQIAQWASVIALIILIIVVLLNIMAFKKIR